MCKHVPMQYMTSYNLVLTGVNSLLLSCCVGSTEAWVIQSSIGFVDSSHPTCVKVNLFQFTSPAAICPQGVINVVVIVKSFSLCVIFSYRITSLYPLLVNAINLFVVFFLMCVLL